jgi:cytoplasmic iron level regulating protein YaaA (DUF328/UPF0246 family)
MSTLLVQSCSKSKISTTEPVQAIDLYSGYFYKIIKKSIRDGEFEEGIDISILSAKYGLITPNELIREYDQRMSKERAEELADEVTEELREWVIEKGYERVVINAGQTYRNALDPDDIPAEVSYISGDGIGTKGHALKKFIRGNDSILQEAP